MDLFQLLQPGAFVVFLLVALRTAGAMAVGPLAVFPGTPLPVRIFLGLGIALAIAPNVPTVAPPAAMQLDPIAMVRELALGLLLGLASNLLFAALQIAAGLIDFQGGFTFGATLDPLSLTQTGPIEHFLQAFAMVLFLDLNGHQVFILTLGQVYQVAPVGAPLQLASMTNATTLVSAVFLAAIAMALPIVTVLLLVDVTLAVFSRVAPQFNLFAVGFTVRVAAALLALVVLLPILATQLGQLFVEIPRLMPALVQQ
jgi:flagellar biosynthetic protein FliR